MLPLPLHDDAFDIFATPPPFAVGASRFSSSRCIDTPRRHISPPDFRHYYFADTLIRATACRLRYCHAAFFMPPRHAEYTPRSFFAAASCFSAITRFIAASPPLLICFRHATILSRRHATRYYATFD